MRKIFVIAARDYRAAVKTKTFIISLLMMGGSILVQLLLKDKVDITDKSFAIVDRSGLKLAEALIAESKVRNGETEKVPDRDAKAKPYKETIFDKDGKQVKPKFILTKESPENETDKGLARKRYELSEKVRRQEYFGFLEIGPDAAKFQRGATEPADAA